MQTIEVSTLKKRLNNKENIHLLDVREPFEREEFNIGGEFIPLGLIHNLQIDAIENLKDEELVVYCRSGMRSMQAALLLETLGFKKIYNLQGGILAWKETNQ